MKSNEVGEHLQEQSIVFGKMGLEVAVRQSIRSLLTGFCITPGPIPAAILGASIGKEIALNSSASLLFELALSEGFFKDSDSDKNPQLN